jgi:hypothetical protein
MPPDNTPPPGADKQMPYFTAALRVYGFSRRLPGSPTKLAMADEYTTLPGRRGRMRGLVPRRIGAAGRIRWGGFPARDYLVAEATSPPNPASSVVAAG